MIPRKLLTYLGIWKNKPHRKPLVLRGARQVGKSHAIRSFSKEHFESLVEINFERMADMASILTKNTPERAIQLLEVQFNTRIIPGKTLLFLDEIQVVPEVLAALRYFFEEIPELHVIAAGSLLDFALAEYEYSIPVGRVEYAYLGPVTFSEFLGALGEHTLLDFLSKFQIKGAHAEGNEELVPIAIHKKAIELVKTYMLIGGMPEAISTFIKTSSLATVEELKQHLFASLRDDFSKYQRRADVVALRRVFERIPRLVGRQVKYVELDREMRAKKLSETLNLLANARVITKVRHSSANGIPLGAEAREDVFKLLFLDVGLLVSASQISPRDIESVDELNLVNKGSLAEQFIGQHLLFRGAPSEEPSLFYWQREGRNASAEIDYILTCRGEIIPVEVKAGKGGALKSLHYFIAGKNSPFGIKFDSLPPREFLGTVTVAGGVSTPYKILSLPHYLIDEVGRIVDSQLSNLSSANA